MITQFLQRCRRSGASARLLCRQHLDRPVHADGKDLVHIRQVGVFAIMLHIGTIAPDPRLDHHAVIGMWSDRARQRQKSQRLFQIHGRRVPALGDRGPRRLRHLFGRLAPLHIGSETPGLQADLVAIVMTQHPVAHRLLAIGGGEGAGIAAFGIVRAAYEGAPRPRGLEVQPAPAAKRAFARIAAIGARRIQMRRQRIVDRLQNLGDAKFGRALQRL